MINYDEIYDDFLEMMVSVQIMKMSDDSLADILEVSDDDDDFEVRVKSIAEDSINTICSREDMWVLIDDFINSKLEEETINTLISSSEEVDEVIQAIPEIMANKFREDLEIKSDEVLH